MSPKRNAKKNRPKIEKWTDIIDQLKIDISKPISYITAKQIKNTSKEEPRLMAKIDSIERLPTSFRLNNLFLLSVSRKKYALVKGVGYHELESMLEKPITYHTSIKLPSSVQGIESENAYLEYAKSCGLLDRVTKTNYLFRTFFGRRTTPNFSFILNNNTVQVDRAQIEIDRVFESEAPHQFFIFEAKIGVPTSFRIQQLYYPFRTLMNRGKPIRNFLFCFEPKQKIYLFWEYEFNPYDNFDSIRLIQSKKYQIKISRSTSLKTYQNIRSDDSKMNIPQADDVNKIIQFPFRVFEGYDTPKKMIDAFGFVIRQSSYFRQAAEILGLISRHNSRYELADTGEKLLKLRPEKRSNFVCKLLLEFPIINEIFIDISSDRNKVYTKQEVMGLLRNKSHLTGSTIERRARTIRSWFRWIRNNLGLVEVDAAGNIRIDRQTRLP